MIEAMKAAGCQDWRSAHRLITLAEAERHAMTFKTIRMIVMGDDGRYWVVSARDAAKLRKAGYETI